VREGVVSAVESAESELVRCLWRTLSENAVLFPAPPRDSEAGAARYLLADSGRVAEVLSRVRGYLSGELGWSMANAPNADELAHVMASLGPLWHWLAYDATALYYYLQLSALWQALFVKLLGEPGVLDLLREHSQADS
jgi:hypothetical protein